MGRLIYEAIMDGLLVGAVYGLMAVGLTLIFGVLDIINIAQGILVIVGAYLSYVLSVHLHIDLFLGLFITVPAMFVIGIAIYWAFIRPLRGAERTSMSLLATYAVALIIEGVLYWVFSPGYVELHGWYVTSSIRLFGFYLPYIYLFAAAPCRGPRPGPLCRPLPDQIRAEHPRHRAGPDRRPARRNQREPGGGAHLRHRRSGDRRWGHGVRRDQRRFQSQQRVRPDLPVAGHRHPRRPREHRRGAGGVGVHDHN